MTKTTIFLIILSVLIAGLMSFYQYIYKAKNKSLTVMFLAFLRFISIFTLLILLINPIFNSKTTQIEKAPLPVIVDNSSSIPELHKSNNIESLYNQIINNKELKEKFDVQFYTFDENFNTNKILDFNGKQTRLDNIAKNLKQYYRNKNYPIVLFTDGNQTFGNNYVYEFQDNIEVNPVVLGDTNTIIDIRVDQINSNKYAFLKNKFPVEVFLQSNSDQRIESDFTITEGNQIIFKEKVVFSKSKKSIIVNALLPATKTGIQKYKVSISPQKNEINKINNSKQFAVEVLDQRSEIAIIADINHPDISALKRSISVNEQRKVTILKINEISDLKKFNLFILYQPNSKFTSVFNYIKNVSANSFIITGKHTDFNFLNTFQNDFNFKSTNQIESYSANFITSFSNFSQENIGFENFSPLENKFVTITPNQKIDILFKSQIRNISLETPLLAFTQNNNQRNGYLFGENIWKWRSENYISKNNFNDFDLFIDKTIQYLVSNDAKKNLIVSHENFYRTGEEINVKAQFFDKNYEFDNNAQLEIIVNHLETKKSLKYNFIKKENDYEVLFNDLKSGKYSFTVKEIRSNSKYSGSFEILEYDNEKQFVNPDKEKLSLLAKNNNGIVYYPNQMERLITKLIKDEKYKPIAKEITQKSSLIDWKWLLILLVITLATEWFVRKYNGFV